MQTVRQYTQQVSVGTLDRRVVEVHHSQAVTPPMTYGERVLIYLCQNFPHRTKLTQRQNRQVDRMQKRGSFRTNRPA